MPTWWTVEVDRNPWTETCNFNHRRPSDAAVKERPRTGCARPYGTAGYAFPAQNITVNPCLPPDNQKRGLHGHFDLPIALGLRRANCHSWSQNVGRGFLFVGSCPLDGLFAGAGPMRALERPLRLTSMGVGEPGGSPANGRAAARSKGSMFSRSKASRKCCSCLRSPVTFSAAASRSA